MLNDRLDVGEPISARIVYADDTGQVCYNWHHILEVFALFVSASVYHSVYMVVVS